MDSFTTTEISQLATLERDAGVQMLSGHDQWPEFCDERRCFHQEFVYDVAMFAVDQDFSWPNVIRSAVLAKDFFPRMAGSDVVQLALLLRDVLSEFLPHLNPVHQHEFTRYLVDMCVIRRRLFLAVLAGRADESTSPSLKVQQPPEPLPLTQGTAILQRESETDVAPALQQMEEDMRHLSVGPQVTLGDVPVPEDGQLDGQAEYCGVGPDSSERRAGPDAGASDPRDVAAHQRHAAQRSSHERSPENAKKQHLNKRHKERGKPATSETGTKGKTK
ncbi:uncharacterized protein C8orf74 homolog [Nematolebias whitei]|uniref:uncharacterized protein C8orf74 homolog n=1 Tax=Nematolebias whitei TaxID=451745 RepID=UPI00189821C7|nr:uncharacterized protein C8orf74 homolog [Nematolebias whitei]